MATYGEMQTRIADELDRSELTAQIKRAIVSAVEFYARKKFYFSESSFTFATVVGQEYYDTDDAAGIATSPNIDILNININSGRVEIDKVSFEHIDDISYLATSSGMPDKWAYRARQIRFYPVPSQVWTITAFSTPRLTALSDDDDTNAWTEDAEELIRLHAKIDVIQNVIRGSDMIEEIVALKAREREVLAGLMGESASRAATGFLAPVSF